MSDSPQSYHEPLRALSAETMDMHRALTSLHEELEAVDWYRQRADACGDDDLSAILTHNMREEIEHASMLLEWLRRNHRGFDEQLSAYLFSQGDIVAAEQPAEPSQEAATEAREPSSNATDRREDHSPLRLTIGSLKEAQ